MRSQISVTDAFRVGADLRLGAAATLHLISYCTFSRDSISRDEQDLLAGINKPRCPPYHTVLYYISLTPTTQTYILY